MDAERREALRLKTKSGNSVPVRNVMITADELRALLARDERAEMLEGLLNEARNYVGVNNPALFKRIIEALGRD